MSKPDQRRSQGVPDQPPLTIDTSGAAAGARTHSPTRPPMSPITPPPGANRPIFTHPTQATQTAIPPPAPQPIEFDSNPDVIALRSAISILQMQARRATADVQTLSKVKDEALADPQAFLQDLVEGKVSSQGGSTSIPTLDEDDDDNDEEVSDVPKEQSKSWSALPTPQNVVRCPPINWHKYAVVGESLDKLHAEQVADPTRGAPGTINSDGTYQFKGGGQEDKYVGIAAPYDPKKDKIDKKPRGKK